MNDEDRIDVVCDLIKELWTERPKQRLGELLSGYVFMEALHINAISDELVCKRLMKRIRIMELRSGKRCQKR